jgi:hypothetical protein
MDKTEIDFLEKELDRINQAISSIAYGGSKDIIEAHIKLWELRGIIKSQIERPKNRPKAYVS